ncbi:MAG: 8-amino-7-oxononanoate synthase [Nitrospirota bacterium]
MASTDETDRYFQFIERLRQLERQHLLRRPKPLQSATGPVVSIDGREVILLASNDYLGLATHPQLIQSAVQATEKFGVGAGASRLVSGTLPPHIELESALARFKGTEAALVFGSGYLANLGMIPALIGSGGLILADRLCHASLIDGCRLSGADFRVFRHRDMEHLESLLRRRPAGRRTLIVTDGLFSMDGDLAPLLDLATLAEQYGAQILIDDAHATGVMGERGRGSLEHFSVESRIPFHMGTLGKALGGIGAYVVGPAPFIDYLINTARSFIFTTAPPPASAAASTAALTILETEPERRARLWANRRHFSSGLRSLGFDTADSLSPIIPVLIGEAERALAMAQKLLEYGVYAPAIRPPTVPKGTSRIRTTVTSEHTSEQLDAALEAFRKAGKDLGLI